MKLITLYLLVGALICGCVRSDKVLTDPTHPHWSNEAPKTFKVKFETSKGEFVLRINRDWAPNGADRFYNLVSAGYYNDARFHRVVKDFIVQFGLAGDPVISQTWKDQYIPDDPVVASNVKGTIAHAFTEPGTRATQLYISMTDNSRLDSIGFSPIGTVIDGFEVVEQIYSGYGETSGGGLRRGDQSRILSEGNAYLDKEFPELDKLIRVSIIE